MADAPNRFVRVLRSGATIVLYAAMLLAVLAMWNPNAPQFIYVAF
ncbi:MAG: hypothetical protein ABI629_04750 [bacterium]